MDGNLGAGSVEVAQRAKLGSPDRPEPCPVYPRLCCKTRKYRFSKILAKVSSSPILARQSLSERIGRPPMNLSKLTWSPAFRN
jgi:hypothetical protein